ncbi:MAG TPA: hypothetical protein VFC27_00925 [Anaerovoracaceae bacterium]|nr:hypothetical protein [Anaerovoracaceae bacterium]
MESTSAFSLKEKAGKKNYTSAIAVAFQGPLRPKNQTWFFFLEIERVKKKEPKKNPFAQKEWLRYMRWLLNYWTKVLIAARKRQGTVGTAEL